MINSPLVSDKKQKLSVENILDDIYLLPKWEMIKSFSVTENNFIFKHKTSKLFLFRKFSSKNYLEKYSLKTEDGSILMNMDLRVYKDSVFIINFGITSFNYFEYAIEKMLQTALEKALYNTSEKEVFINLSEDTASKNKIKKILLVNGFSEDEDQSDYEKNMFGEELHIKLEQNDFWIKKIKQEPILINK